MTPRLNFSDIKKAAITLLLMIFVFLPHNSWFDNMAENYTEQGIQRTLITYAVSRSLNGVISVVQGTEVAVSPVGVGLTFTPGQILDPVNDLIERFSQIVLISSASLGIQRLFLEMTSAVIVSWLVSALGVLFIILIWVYKYNDSDAFNYQALVKKTFLLLIFLRFSIPLVAVMSEGLYLSFLQPRYEQSQALLEQASDNIQTMNASVHKKTPAVIENESLVDKAERWLNSTQQSLDIEKQIDALKQSAAKISQQVINMIVVFVAQMIIFPLLFLWLIYRAGRSLVIY
ncbi:hypothetical protein MNBD_GAMMA11-973 [hydrothermal vent metagenome]|uniref:Uncharacterized protein n=1 Tax=hydrothermal vent metagenome TaxID=652676 RepID=A0A3B0X326_9ZZZZ